jgi:hypothetical protein
MLPLPLLMRLALVGEDRASRAMERGMSKGMLMALYWSRRTRGAKGRLARVPYLLLAGAGVGRPGGLVPVKSLWEGVSGLLERMESGRRG